MGCASSIGSVVPDPPMTDLGTAEPGDIWEVFVNTKSLHSEITGDKAIPDNFSDSMFELRLFMDQRVLMKSLLNFGTCLGFEVFFLCWVDIQSFRRIDAGAFDQQRFAASSIIEEYLMVESKNFVKLDGSEELLARFEELVDDGDFALDLDMFAKVQLHCFNTIFQKVWERYVADAAYTEAMKQFKSHNKVGVDDFQYFEKLGKGGYGVVVHGVKRSTSKHYAIKVQYKSHLLQVYQDSPARVNIEREAMAKLKHPFIMGLDYAYQSRDCVMTAMELGRSGTLKDSLKQFFVLGEDRVRFYAAEITLALAHIHQMGLMYRDLKPSNVLLMPDGHIKLVDLGGVVDPQNRSLKLPNVPSGGGGLALSFLSQYAADTAEAVTNSLRSMRNSENSVSSSRNSLFRSSMSSSKVRAFSIMGTPGYIAPEMLKMTNQQFELYDEGYSRSVDYWSLGVTILELLLGYLPLKGIDVSNFLSSNSSPSPVYMEFLGDLKHNCRLTSVAFDIISHFLNPDGLSRLGAGPKGVSDIKRHPFFSSIKWSKLAARSIEPPFLPKVHIQHSIPFGTFEEMLQNYGWRRYDTISVNQNACFSNWDYASNNTILAELGVRKLIS